MNNIKFQLTIQFLIEIFAAFMFWITKYVSFFSNKDIFKQAFLIAQIEI